MKFEWHNLSERDRIALILGGVIVVLYLFCLFIYSPLNNAIQKEKNQVIENKETLSWMRQVSNAKGQPNIENVSKSKLLSLIAFQLAKQSFNDYPYVLQQTTDHDISLSYDSVPFNAFMAWLWSLQQHYSIRIKQIDIKKIKPAGLVKLQLILSV